MKIIGTTNDGFILSASATEVANLIGYHSEYSLPRKTKPAVGDEINVAKMYRHLYDLGNTRKEIRDMESKLRLAADLIGTLPDPVTNAEAKPDNEQP